MSLSKNPTVNEMEGEFKKFAEFLFNQDHAPPKNTLFVDLDCKDDTEFCHFLYDLFCYGCTKKFEGVPLTDITEDHFNIIREYIRSLGADVILLGYEKNGLNEVVSLRLSFIPYYD